MLRQRKSAAYEDDCEVEYVHPHDSRRLYAPEPDYITSMVILFFDRGENVIAEREATKTSKTMMCRTLSLDQQCLWPEVHRIVHFDTSTGSRGRVIRNVVIDEDVEWNDSTWTGERVFDFFGRNGSSSTTGSRSSGNSQSINALRKIQTLIGSTLACCVCGEPAQAAASTTAGGCSKDLIVVNGITDYDYDLSLIHI